MLGLCGGQRTFRPARRVQRQPGGLLQEGGGGGHPSSRLRPASRALQLSGHGLVGPNGCPRSMPRLAVWIEFRISDVGEGTVDVLPIRRGR